jgi:hypothetical protein
MIGFGLENEVEEIGVAGLFGSGLCQVAIEGVDHADEFQIGHQIFGGSDAHALFAPV